MNADILVDVVNADVFVDVVNADVVNADVDELYNV